MLSGSEQGNSSRVQGLLASLDLIAKASAQLLRPSAEAVSIVPTILEVSRALVSADAYAVWKISETAGWHIVAARGLSPTYQQNFIPPSALDRDAAQLIAASDVFEHPVLAARRELYVGEGIRALMAVPLLIEDQVLGTLTFYYNQVHEFTAEEKTVATALANMTAAALATSELNAAQVRAKQRAEFLSEASQILSSSLDYPTTIAAVARLAVPHIADWCVVEMVVNGELKRLAVAHVDPAKVSLAEEFRRQYPPKLDSDSAVAAVIRTGKSNFVPLVTEEMLEAAARDKSHLELLRSMGIKSAIIVPLAVCERVLGALTLVTTERVMDTADVKLAEDLGRRSALAIDNARLFQALEQSERKFRVVTETVPCAIYINDGNRLLYVNQAAIELSGYSADELKGMDIFDLVHPEDRELVRRRAENRLKGRPAPRRYEFRGVRKDGRIVWLDFSGSVIEYDGRRALLATAFDATERKLAEEQLQRSEAEARTLLENFPDTVARYGPDLRYLYMSPSVLKLTGMPPEFFIGKTHREIGFPPELCELFDGSVRKILQSGKPDSIEFTTIDSEGKEHYLLGLGVPQFAEDGTVESVLTISRDITQHRLAEEAVRRNERELRLLTDTLPALVAYVGKDQRVLRGNKTFEYWFGHPAESFIGKHLNEFLKAENYERLRPRIEGVLRGAPQRFEATNDYVDKRRHVLVSYLPDFDEQGQVRGFAALVQDISEEREARKALEESEQRLRRFAEAGPAVLYSNLADGSCDYVSQRFLDFTGLPLHQVLGHGWTAAVHPDDLPSVERSWNDACLRGRRYEAEFRFRRHDGVYRWFRSWSVPVRDENGNLVRWFGACMDVEEQKRSEEALRKSEKLAAVGRLAASISHEINNPLESVTNLVYLAKSDPDLPGRVYSFLSTAERELARVSQIATQTLRFHRQTSRPAHAHIPEMIDSILAIYEGRLANSQVRVQRKYSHSSEPIHVFEGELRQVVANLVANAIDATPAGGRLIVRECRCRRWSNGERGVRITIADTGRGISPELMSRIFEPFFTTKTSTGTGLGLWVSREIIEKHGGYIRVRSQVGRGTVFVFFLPELVAEVQASAS